MNPDREVDEILEFIADELNRIKGSEYGKLKQMAKEAGLSAKNMSDFSNKYGKGSNPNFRTVYKLLKILLGRKPINLTHPIDTHTDPTLIEALDKIKLLIQVAK